jgi:iron complex outermembrane recepter protein
MKTILKLASAPTAIGIALVSMPAFAQEAAAADEGDAVIVVTGSRIARPNLDANSPIIVATGEQLTQHADITLDQFLNTLPAVNPAGTTTSNNPGNGGQANINLRGLGSNRNLVLINGRRPMVSATDQSVDLNTIPQALIQRVEVVTGGAGATYGADAIAGVVNMILKDDFEGLDLRASYMNSVSELDSEEYQISGTIGGNFADGRGNIALSAEYSSREPLLKSQRPFSDQATSTTGTPPMGRYVGSGTNPIDPAALTSLFAGYGVAAGQVPLPSQILFNNDGTLAGNGVFNSPVDAANYRFDPTGRDSAAANQNFFPDFYSYNFDFVNLLVLPLERKSAFFTAKYEIVPEIEFFTQGGYTEYSASQALAPTPVGTRIENTCGTNPLRAKSDLITCGSSITGLVAPVTNPFVSADLLTLMNSRTGDDAAFTGAGAAEGIRISKRFLDTGLRRSDYNNEVMQGMVGFRGELSPRWRYEAYYSWGRTIIDQRATGNVNVQKVLDLLAAPDGGNSLCAGGFNPFGINPLSQACIEYIDEVGITKTKFTQKVAQAYISGDAIDLPAGPLGVVFGLEKRNFNYSFDPGTLFGPIAGFNTSTPDHGTNSFTDFFAEARIPILKDASFAQSLELSLGYRRSKSDFNDIQNGVNGDPQNSDAYKVELSWQPIDSLRVRGSYQHSVRAPNFGELFSGGSSFPQYFDPCSITSNFRTSGGAGAAALCQGTGIAAASINSYVQTPGSQVFTGIVGNPNLSPEKGDTWTGGLVFNQGNLIMSLDYYNIAVKDTIFAPDPNMLIAACYNYHGLNPTMSAASPYCTGLSRTPDISFISIPVSLGGDGSGYFQAVNQGKVKTSGIDFQLGYKLPTDFVGGGSELRANLAVNYVIDFKIEELPGVTIDYAGTAAYFGAGLGQTFPRWKANLDLAWKLDPLTISTRIRHIDGMENRASRQFVGETFSGPKSITYVDMAAEVEFDALTLRLGVNNLFDTSAPEYAPNVQSGTDPSIYDVIGRRGYVSVRLRY